MYANVPTYVPTHATYEHIRVAMVLLPLLPFISGKEKEPLVEGVIRVEGEKPPGVHRQGVDQDHLGRLIRRGGQQAGDLAVGHVVHPVVDDAHGLRRVRVAEVHVLESRVVKLFQGPGVRRGNVDAVLDEGRVRHADFLLVILVVEDVGHFLEGAVDVHVGDVVVFHDGPQLLRRAGSRRGAEEDHGENDVDAEGRIRQISRGGFMAAGSGGGVQQFFV